LGEEEERYSRRDYPLGPRKYPMPELHPPPQLKPLPLQQAMEDQEAHAVSDFTQGTDLMKYQSAPTTAATEVSHYLI
jgi:hypothetical protein